MKQLLVGAAWLLLFGGACAHAEGYRPSGTASSETTYVFAPHPYLNPQDLYKAYEPVARYLESRIPGTRFRIETSKDYADYETKIAAGRFDFGLPNPYQTVFSLGHGYHVIAKMKPDEDFRGMLVVRKGHRPQAPAELAGKTLCFPSPTAVAATMLPMLYLHDHGLDIHKAQVKYVGSQFSSIMNVYTDDATACGTTVRFWRTWSRENPDKVGALETVWLTDPLPHNGVIARSDVPPELARRVAAALVAMDQDKTLDQSQFKADQQHFEPATNDTYRPMAAFLKHYDETIGLPPQMKGR